MKLGHCASLLALSSTADWVSCNEEVAVAWAQNNLIQRSTQPAVPHDAFLLNWYYSTLFVSHQTIQITQGFVATLIHLNIVNQPSEGKVGMKLATAVTAERPS